MNKLLAALAAGLALGGAASANTARAPAGAAPGVLVRYGGLDLDSRAGVASLHARLQRAARAACSPLDRRVLALRGQHRQCVSQALAQGVRDVGLSGIR